MAACIKRFSARTNFGFLRNSRITTSIPTISFIRNSSKAAAESTSAIEYGPNDKNILPNFINRNPQNLQQMLLARKPCGFHLDQPSRNYWYKLKVNFSKRNITATVEHNSGEVLAQASTAEWPIRKQLYSSNDVTAAINIGEILARRCLECGVTAVHVELTKSENSSPRVTELIKAFEQAGVFTTEPEPIVDTEKL